MVSRTLYGEKKEGGRRIGLVQPENARNGPSNEVWSLPDGGCPESRRHMDIFCWFTCKEDSPKVLGLFWGTFDQSGGCARGPSYVVCMSFLWFECLNVRFLPFLTHGGGF